ncbi:unnamed protein product [Linum trigynum]|uniref:Uncharacterized protein n=1 Tax=Linum trigynum TaxID=586398 RepID=A0AAV2ELW8_9ROSI
MESLLPAPPAACRCRLPDLVHGAVDDELGQNRGPDEHDLQPAVLEHLLLPGGESVVGHGVESRGRVLNCGARDDDAVEEERVLAVGESFGDVGSRREDVSDLDGLSRERRDDAGLGLDGVSILVQGLDPESHRHGVHDVAEGELVGAFLAQFRTAATFDDSNLISLSI